MAWGPAVNRCRAQGGTRTERRVPRITCTEVIDGRGCTPELADQEATRVGVAGIVHIHIYTLMRMSLSTPCTNREVRGSPLAGHVP